MTLIELILHCDTVTEGCVSNDFFRHSLDDSPASYLTYLGHALLVPFYFEENEAHAYLQNLRFKKELGSVCMCGEVCTDLTVKTKVSMPQASRSLVSPYMRISWPLNMGFFNMLNNTWPTMN